MPDALINGLACAGGGIVAQLLTYSLQTVNSRQQTERDPSKPAFKDDAVCQLCLVVKNEGWERLYGGAVARRHRGLSGRRLHPLGDPLEGLVMGPLGCFNRSLSLHFLGYVYDDELCVFWIVVTRIQTHRKANKTAKPSGSGFDIWS